MTAAEPPLLPDGRVIVKSSNTAECIHVGTELLELRINTHTPFIAKKLLALGLKIRRAQIVGDNLGVIQEAMKSALAKNDLVIVTGGLGPTFDDLTREAASEFLKRRLLLHDEIVKKIRGRFNHLGLAMPQNNKKQAHVLEGARVLDNDVGTAPGQLIKIVHKLLVLLPGPPKELENTLDKALPFIQKEFPCATCLVKTFKIVGLPESCVEEKAKILLKTLNTKQIEPIILASPYVIDLIFRVRGQPSAAIAKIKKGLIKIFGQDFLGEDEVTLESVVNQKLAAQKRTLSVAESCTGGLIAHRITNVAGSSACFLESIVAYSNKAKIHHFGVKPNTLKKFGAVSCEVANEMALGILRQSKSDYALSVTGTCGPSGGTPQKPVGLACFGLAEQGEKTLCVEKLFSGDRDVLKERMSSFALDLLRRRLLATRPIYFFLLFLAALFVST